MDNNGQRLMVVDLDNTLFFTDKCIKKASKEIAGITLDSNQVRKLDKKEKRQILSVAFSKYWKESIPNRKMLRLLKSNYKKSDMKVIILTARFSDSKKNTIKLLSKNNVPYNRLICRESKYRNMHDEEWKLLTLKNIIKTTKPRSVELFEDKRENITHIAPYMKGVEFASYMVGKESIVALDT